MWLFKSKKQVESLKGLEELFPDHITRDTTTFHLSGVRISYNLSDRKPFSASIDYKERPKDWGNQGCGKLYELTGSTWADLIDKVIAHFAEQEDSDNS